MDEAWVLDERAYAGQEHLDPEFVAGYDRKQGFPEASDDIAILEALGVGSSSVVVDMGAGTGRFALAAAERFGRVVAVDVSPAMVRTIRERIADAGLTNVEVVLAGFLTYRHEGASADAVHTRNALHQVPDFWKAVALQRIAGFLRSGGVLRLDDLIYDFAPADAERVFAHWFDTAASDPRLGYTREDFVTHIRSEHSTFRWLLEPMLDAAGFEIVSATFDRSVYGDYTCVKR